VGLALGQWFGQLSDVWGRPPCVARRPPALSARLGVLCGHVLDRPLAVARLLQGLGGPPAWSSAAAWSAISTTSPSRHALFASDAHLRPGTNDRSIDRRADPPSHVVARGSSRPRGVRHDSLSRLRCSGSRDSPARTTPFRKRVSNPPTYSALLHKPSLVAARSRSASQWRDGRLCRKRDVSSCKTATAHLHSFSRSSSVSTPLNGRRQSGHGTSLCIDSAPRL